MSQSAKQEVLINKIVILCLAAWLIGVSKAGFGGGFGMLVTPMLAAVMPAKTVVGFMLPLLFAMDILSLCYYWKCWDKHNIRQMIPGTVVGIAGGGYILNDISDLHLKKVIGGIACLFALIDFLRARLVAKRVNNSNNADIAIDVPFKAWHGVAAGILAGTFSMLSHLGGLIVTMYLLPQRLSNQAFVGTTTAIYFLINLLKIPFYIKFGLFTLEGLIENIALLPYIVLGGIVGVLLNRRFSPHLFSGVIRVFVFATGVKLLFW